MNIPTKEQVALYFKDVGWNAIVSVGTATITCVYAILKDLPLWAMVVLVLAMAVTVFGIIKLIGNAFAARFPVPTRHLTIQQIFDTFIVQLSEAKEDTNRQTLIRAVQAALAPINTPLSEYFYKEFITRFPHDSMAEISARAISFLKIYSLTLRDQDIGFQPVLPKDGSQVKP